VGNIIELLSNQFMTTQARVRAVLLVGGFSQNTYLKERLRKSFALTEVLQSPDTGAAAVRGAVIMGIAQSDPSGYNS